ncbi:hypothetical protein AVEN_171687-1 [Araneus ventricosus]|uniref:Uncharacterized protein n=1 Tax=Araneus ventricosus TaxID=182803 RepID=A0A4Y2T2F6_ARAVE|nr:hypothetical protein AVEN_64655-1 [Araneus ventricosus]GBN92109.1 hypothetical protein AVEN_65814-1 [Araneus ventricosus]GBN93315.1 hypothetical protein AVEN_135812-1 [Araneus ventricosus]GBN93318.1 hypothetical protein AVEN_171687-1 [Araneus ventricosus]
MNVFPKEAPVYGGGKIIVELYNELPREGANYYLVFKGSQQRHTVCAIPTWNNNFLQLSAAIPSLTYSKFLLESPSPEAETLAPGSVNICGIVTLVDVTYLLILDTYRGKNIEEFIITLFF